MMKCIGILLLLAAAHPAFTQDCRLNVELVGTDALKIGRSDTLRITTPCLERCDITVSMSADDGKVFQVKERIFRVRPARRRIQINIYAKCPGGTEYVTREGEKTKVKGLFKVDSYTFEVKP